MRSDVGLKKQDEGEPNLVMGDEVYDDAKECLMMLPERSMLVDFVESLPKIANIVHKVVY